MKMNYITQFGNVADLGIWINPICMVSFGLGVFFLFLSVEIPGEIQSSANYFKMELLISTVNTEVFSIYLCITCNHKSIIST